MTFNTLPGIDAPASPRSSSIGGRESVWQRLVDRWFAWRLDRLIASAPNAKPIYVRWRKSGRLDSGSRSNNVARLFDDEFFNLRDNIVRLFGTPTLQMPKARDWFNGWYPECLDAAAWEIDDKLLCLAIERPGFDGSFGLVLRCFTREEIAELLA